MNAALSMAESSRSTVAAVHAAPDAAERLVAAEAALLQAEAELRRLRDEFVRLLAFVDAEAAPLVRRVEAAREVVGEQNALIAKQNELITVQASRIQTLKAAAAHAPGWRKPPRGKRPAAS